MADLSRLPALLQAEDWAAAERVLRRAANAKSAPAEVFFNLAKVLEKTGKSGQRVQWLRRAVLRRSDYAKAWFELGRAELEALDLRAAHRAFDKAHKLDPGDSDARRMFARLCLRLGQWDKAAMRKTPRPDWRDIALQPKPGAAQEPIAMRYCWISPCGHRRSRR